MNERDVVYCRHILDAILDIEKSIGSLSKKEFESNKDVKDATLRRLEVIGEAVKYISNELKDKYPFIPWKKIAGTRDVIIHAYFNVDWNLVWDILKKDILELKENIKNIFKNEKIKL
jgi:uncharacterized protein with HEPN domain